MMSIHNAWAVRPCDAQFAVVDHNAAAIGGIDAGQDLHQRRSRSAVLAHGPWGHEPRPLSDQIALRAGHAHRTRDPARKLMLVDAG